MTLALPGCAKTKHFVEATVFNAAKCELDGCIREQVLLKQTSEI